MSAGLQGGCLLSFSQKYAGNPRALEPKENTSYRTGTRVRELRKGSCGQRSPSRKNQRRCGWVCLHGAPTSAISHGSAIWFPDVAYPQPLVFLGNEQGQEREQGFL